MLEGTDLSSAYSSMSGMASGGMNDSYSQEEELPPMKQPKQEKASRDDTNIIYKQATMDNSNNDQKLAALMTELKKKKAAQATEEQPSYFDKLFGKKKELLKIISAWFSLESEQDGNFESGLALSDDWSRYFLKVGDGCNQFCSYCIIPYARGRIQSRSSGELLEEARRAIKAGFAEIVLAGIHLGRYGQDFEDGKTSLNNLLRALLALPGLGRIRLSSIEINEVDDELISLMKNNPQICQHLHISLQSGSDKILKLMRRPYDTEYFRARVAALRQNLPLIALTTDIIVGFPGATEDDFQKTLEFAAEIGFSKIHVFPFSAHEKTPAFTMPNKIESREIKRRARELRDLSDKLEEKYRQKIMKELAGQELPVILEAVFDDQVRLKTEFYFDLVWPLSKVGLTKETAEKKIGQLIQIKI